MSVIRQACMSSAPTPLALALRLYALPRRRRRAGMPGGIRTVPLPTAVRGGLRMRTLGCGTAPEAKAAIESTSAGYRAALADVQCMAVQPLTTAAPSSWRRPSNRQGVRTPRCSSWSRQSLLMNDCRSSGFGRWSLLAGPASDTSSVACLRSRPPKRDLRITMDYCTKAPDHSRFGSTKTRWFEQLVLQPKKMTKKGAPQSERPLARGLLPRPGRKRS